jgi:hypothetical protein
MLSSRLPAATFSVVAGTIRATVERWARTTHIWRELRRKTGSAVEIPTRRAASSGARKAALEPRRQTICPPHYSLTDRRYSGRNP